METALLSRDAVQERIKSVPKSVNKMEQLETMQKLKKSSFPNKGRHKKKHFFCFSETLGFI